MSEVQGAGRNLIDDDIFEWTWVDNVAFFVFFLNGENCEGVSHIDVVKKTHIC